MVACPWRPGRALGRSQQARPELQERLRCVCKSWQASYCRRDGKVGVRHARINRRARHRQIEHQPALEKLLDTERHLDPVDGLVAREAGFDGQVRVGVAIGVKVEPRRERKQRSHVKVEMESAQTLDKGCDVGWLVGEYSIDNQMVDRAAVEVFLAGIGYCNLRIIQRSLETQPREKPRRVRPAVVECHRMPDAIWPRPGTLR